MEDRLTHLFRIQKAFDIRHINLTLSTLGKIFSRQHFEIFFSFFPRNQDLTFHANCLQGDNLHEMSDPVYVKNKKNIINLSSAENAQRVVKVKSKLSGYGLGGERQ